METATDTIFQIDADPVVHTYNNHPNYLVQYNEQNQNDLCAVYFSSNKIYYPNTEKVFTEDIIQKNRYEWYGLRIKEAHKHIFVRDIKKQWYQTGINATVNSPAALAGFLAAETKGYRVITIGSSAGGFAAILFGQLLHAERTYCFNAQYEINSLLTDSDKKTNPLIFRNAGNPELRKYFDTKGFITHPERIYYFYSNKSNWDIEQHAHIKDLGINVISFNTNTHGPPVLKCSMSAVLSLSEQQLKGFVGKENKPFWFSCKLVGFPVTVAGVYDQVIAKVKNKTRNLMSTGKLH